MPPRTCARVGAVSVGMHPAVGWLLGLTFRILLTIMSALGLNMALPTAVKWVSLFHFGAPNRWPGGEVPRSLVGNLYFVSIVDYTFCPSSVDYRSIYI